MSLLNHPELDNLVSFKKYLIQIAKQYSGIVLVNIRNIDLKNIFIVDLFSLIVHVCAKLKVEVSV